MEEELRVSKGKIVELEKLCSDTNVSIERGIETTLSDLSKKMDDLHDTMKSISQVGDENKVTYAGKVKGKNLLVVKSADDSKGIGDKKKDVARALGGIPIVDTRFSNKGNVVVNFEDSDVRDDAARLIQGNVEGVVTKKVGKLQPKIMICNVQREEDDVLEAMIERNEVLRSIPGVREKFTFVLKKQAAGHTDHYIFKCAPEVRRAIHDNGDKVMLQWGRYGVRDRYHVLTCFYCQRYGHVDRDCKFKEQHRVCGICSGNHETRGCSSTSFKCINCLRQKKSDTEHKVNSRCCRAFDAEILRLASITDHGY